MNRTVAISLVGAALVTSFARAQAPLAIETLEHGPWPAAVSALQQELRSQGQLVQVLVRDDAGRVVPCERYALSLDEAGASAFRVVGCDPATGATALALVSRSALFERRGDLSRPRAITLVATEVRTGAASGGAALTGGASLACSVGVRPYVDDLENGARVELGPDRYEVRARAVGVNVQTQSQGWLLSGSQGAIVVEYDVVDRASGEVVLHDRAALVCGNLDAEATPSTAPPAIDATPASAAADRVLVIEAMHTGRVSEVVGVVDVDDPYVDQATALRMLRERAAALGADAVVGVHLRHPRLDLPPAHLTGLAVRFRRNP